MQKNNLRVGTKSSCVCMPNSLNEMMLRRYSPIALKFFAVYISKLQKQDSYIEKSLICFPIHELVEQFHISSTKALTVRNSVLVGKLRDVYFEELNEHGRWDQYPVFTRIGYDPVTKEFNMRMNYDLWEKAKDLSQYTKWQMYMLAPLRSKHAIRLYQLLYQYKNSNHKSRYFELIELHRLMDVQDNVSYKDFRNFKSKVLEKSIKEIQAVSLPIYNISMELKKSGRKVIGITFLFDYDAKKEEDILSGVIEHSSVQDKNLKDKVETYLSEKVPEIVGHEGGPDKLLHILMSHNQGITYRDILSMTAKELDRKSR